MAKLALLLSCVLGAIASADVVTTTDGRRFEGEIIQQTDDRVVIDTMVANIRTRITMAMPEIAGVERAPLPDGFFDPPPPPARLSKPTADTEGLYLEIPLQGRFGEQIYAEGVIAALRYVRRHNIGHVVITLDTEGGDVDEAAAIYEQLRREAGNATIHTLVRRAGGAGVALAIFSDTIFVRPGAVIGGGIDLEVRGTGEGSEVERQVLTSQIATEVAREADSRGRQGDIIGAMIDPREQIAIWRVGDSELAKGVLPPPDVDAADIIVQDGADEALTLDFDQLVELGVPVFDGTVEQLGEFLEIDGWRAESDYGRRALLNAATNMQRREGANQLRFEKAIAENIAHRDKTMRAIDGNLELAKQWDPLQGDYSAYGSTFNWNWGRGPRPSSGSRTWTQESRWTWQMRSDNCLGFMNRAYNAMRTMKKLDKEAVELGLEPYFEDGELDLWMTDIRTKINAVEAQRNRRGG